jgi:excisionase family DNA binding protein
MIERLLNAHELADLLGFSASTIVDWAERGDLPSFKMGGRLRFRESESLAWIESKRKHSSPPPSNRLTLVSGN